MPVLSAMLRFFKNLAAEVRSLNFFFRKLEKTRREIVFYAEDAASYGYFEGLINYLTRELDLDVCYFTSDSEDPVFDKQDERLRVFYINALLPYFTRTLDSKLLIMTMPDLHRFHVKRSERGAHHVYMFHNIGSSFPVIRFGALFHYDTIFCAGPHHKEEIRRQEELYSLSKKDLLEFGYYRLEKVYGEFAQYKDTAPEAPGLRGRVLFGPSWGEQSALNLCGAELIRNLLVAGYEVTLRPHPMTHRKSPALISSLKAEFGGMENFIFEPDISPIESLMRADVLVSDWSGLVYEYAFGTERPVLFIDVPPKAVNPRYREVGIEPVDVGIRDRIGVVLGAGEIDRAGEAVAELIERRDEYKGEILRARDEFVYNFPGGSGRGGGGSSQAGALWIRDFLYNGLRDGQEI